MKTKTNAWSKFLIVFAALLWCFSSGNSFAQSPIIPYMHDFYGTWSGVNQQGETVQITLGSNGRCDFMVGGVPIHSDNPVAAYRLPQYSPQVLSTNPITAPEITIKFFTHNALATPRVSASADPSSSSISNNTNATEQVYTGVAVLSYNASGGLEMILYSDINNYSSTIPDASSAVPYCTLAKQ